MKHTKLIIASILVLAVLVALPALALEPIYVGRVTLEDMPENWNPVGPEAAGKDAILALTGEPLYRVTESGELLPAQAAQLPEDVTAEYAGRYGIPADAARGYAFAIGIREDACWEDGKAVTAADWYFTANKLLETDSFPLEIANYRSFLRGETGPAEQVISLKKAGFASVSEAEAAGHTVFYIDITHFWGVDAGWRRISDRTPLEDAAIPSGCEEMYLTAEYLYRNYLSDSGSQKMFQKEFVGIAAAEGEKLTAADVGLVAEENRLVLVLSEPAAASYVAAKMADLMPVRPGIYDDAYGTDGHYCACGAYRIASVTKEEISLEPNPYWNGEPAEFQTVRCRADG